MEAHLARWTREVADVRVHGTTGEAPIERFARDEAAALRPLSGRPPFRQIRELTRVVQADGCVELDTNRYSVPWRLIGARVTVAPARARSSSATPARRSPVMANGAAAASGRCGPSIWTASSAPGGARLRRPIRRPPPELLRPLAEYESLLGGAW